MKIVHIINRLIGGGAEVMIAQIHREHLRLGHDSWIVSMETGDDRGTPNVIAFGKKYPRWKEPLLLRKKLVQLEKEIGKIDVLHTHLTQSQLFAKFAIRGLKHRPLLVTTEHDTSNRRRHWGWIGRVMDRVIFRNYDRIICISEGVRNSLKKWLPSLKDSALVVIHNGVRVDALHELPLRDQANEKVHFLSVGRVIPKKNFALTIEALSRLVDKNWHYTIVGDGEQKAELEELVAKLGLEEQVQFTGYVKDVSPCYERADCFLLPSLWEGFGLVAVEAMAAGLPVIAADVPGLAEVVGSSGESGKLVKSWDVDIWKNEITWVMKNQSWLAAAAKNARERSRKFDIKKTSEDYLNLYGNLMEVGFVREPAQTSSL